MRPDVRRLLALLLLATAIGTADAERRHTGGAVAQPPARPRRAGRRLTRAAALAMAAVGGPAAGAQRSEKILLEEELFWTLDRNADGVVDKKELRAGMLPWSEIGSKLDLVGLQQADTLFAQSDFNGDGVLDFPEVDLMIQITSDHVVAAERTVVRKIVEGIVMSRLQGYHFDSTLMLVAHAMADAEDGMTPDQVIKLAEDLVESEGPFVPLPFTAMSWMREMVHSADFNRNGQLSKDEMMFVWDKVADALQGRAEAVSEAMDAFAADEAELEKNIDSFKEVDVNGDGEIQREEWLSAVAEAAGDGSQDDEADRVGEWAFNAADEDESGGLDKEEFVVAMADSMFAGAGIEA